MAYMQINCQKKKNLPGVFPAIRKDGSVFYRASITYHNKHISLGSYITASLAHKAYLEASRLSSPDSRLTISSYNSKRILSFEKWVSIINYRDTGFYFKTPIYMKKKYFIYYLDSQTELKFDVDDLFYYSNHSIMRRDGHLFVADYGMQVNIRNRYGIKNFAVANKDYIYVNGDEYDYRYGNIKIINRYNGVTKVTKSGRDTYVAKIHIVGDYLIGRYSDEIDAALAYNKAVDILREKGIDKNYQINYIDELNPIQYATRYSMIKVSKAIREYNKGL